MPVPPECLNELVDMIRHHTVRAHYLAQKEALAAWSDEVAKPRHADPKRLTRHGYKVYSQNDEDGIIAEIFSRIGTTNRIFVEFGVETGIECNTVKLLVEGWRGLWIEADPASAGEIRANFSNFIASSKLNLVERMVTAENIDVLIALGGVSGEIDLLSIDIDYNDYWVWRAIDQINPRVVVIEYNATLRPPMSIVVPYCADGCWDGTTNYYGASLEAMVRLGCQKGYRIVGCSLSGVNAFFVREDLCADKFHEPSTAAEHYEPPRYFLYLLPAGHCPRPGLFEQV